MKDYSCTDKSATCSQEIKYNPKEQAYQAKTFCMCQSSDNFTLAQKDQTCQDTCDGYCQHGHCVIERKQGRKVCNCLDGYFGEKCDQFDGSVDSVKGFRVATIVLGVLTGVLLIILVVIIVRRFVNRY